MTERSNYRADERPVHGEALLSQQQRTALRQAVVVCMEKGADSAAADILGQSARVARDTQLKPEHFVRLLRTMWYEHRPSQLPSVDHEPGLVQLIDIALDAYFAKDSHAGNGVTNVGDASEF